MSPGVRGQVTVPVAHRLVTHGGDRFTGVMTKNHDLILSLTSDPAQHPAVFAAAFNSGDLTAVEAVYEDLGILVPSPGVVVAGPERGLATNRFLELGIPIDVRPRHVYVADDIALLIVDWSISGVGVDGTSTDIQGTATDVARRGPDGKWRYIIDNPFGTA